jgi:hypothetical protein
MPQRVLRYTRRFETPEWLLVSAIVAMLAFFVREQWVLAQMMPTTQDGLNQLLLSRTDELTRRLDHIDSMSQALVVGVFVQLIALVIWMLKQGNVLR